METYEVAGTSGGKFHRLQDATVTPESAFRPTLALCGRTVTPSNYFLTAADASSYCGGRLATYGCKQCGLALECVA